MAEWIEVPAHRVLRVDLAEFDLEYERLNEDGRSCLPGEIAAIIRRTRDGRVFRQARWIPSGSAAHAAIYIEEA